MPSQTDFDEKANLQTAEDMEANDVALAKSRKDLADATEKMDISEVKAEAGDLPEGFLLTGHKTQVSIMSINLDKATEKVNMKKGILMSLLNAYRHPREQAMGMMGEQQDYHVTDAEDDGDNEEDKGNSETDGSAAQAGAEDNDSHKSQRDETGKRARDDKCSGAESEEEQLPKKAK